MKMQIIFFLLICGTLIGHHICYSEDAAAVQIVHLENHSIRVDLETLKQIFGNEHIKDRNVMIFSIAGPYRKGKSFFLNFPLKYLYAKYVTHDVSDWLGEGTVDSTELHGFKWSGGQMQQTTGIWMWSEIFTHDYHNGDRVAIVLLDTQGIFDHESSTMDCTKTFAISMMLSSVQCYNVMQNVQEDNLQDLDFFTAYGRLAIEQTNEKPFQKLLFLVRDWPYADEIWYGYAPQYVRRILASNDKQSTAMHELRDRIKVSFEKIEAFLMPYPGTAVAEGRNTNGDLRKIDARFIQSIKEIVPSLFAPENLVMKQINGQRIRASDLIAYIEEYTKIFDGDTLPEPRTALWATAETSLLILHRDCLNIYMEMMQEVMANRHFDYEIPALLDQHEIARKESMSQFQQELKLNFPDLVSAYKNRLELDIAVKYRFFLELNANRKADRLRIEQEQQKSEDLRRYIVDGTLEKRWGDIRNIAMTGFYGMCMYVGWNFGHVPYGLIVCAVLGVSASIFGHLLDD